MPELPERTLDLTKNAVKLNSFSEILRFLQLAKLYFETTGLDIFDTTFETSLFIL